MEVELQIKLKALEKVKTALANAPDLDIEKVNYKNSTIFVFCFVLDLSNTESKTKYFIHLFAAI